MTQEYHHIAVRDADGHPAHFVLSGPLSGYAHMCQWADTAQHGSGSFAVTLAAMLSGLCPLATEANCERMRRQTTSDETYTSYGRAAVTPEPEETVGESIPITPERSKTPLADAWNKQQEEADADRTSWRPCYVCGKATPYRDFYSVPRCTETC